MTTLVAVKKGKKICLASDSLSVFGSRKEEAGKHVYGAGKILEIGPNLVGIAGHASWGLILADYFLKKKNIPLWETVDQIFELFNSLHEDLKKRYYLIPPHLTFLPFESSDFQLLIINSCGIFEVEHSRVVRHYKRYSAIGTGEEYALGAVSSVYNLLEDPEEIAKIGIQSAAQFDQKTGLPVYARCVQLSVIEP